MGRQMTAGWSQMAIFARYVVSRIRCIFKRKLLQDANRKPYASYRMVSRSVTMKIKWVLWRFWCSTNGQKLVGVIAGFGLFGIRPKADFVKRTAIGVMINHIGLLHIFRFASVARVLSALLNFLVYLSWDCTLDPPISLTVMKWSYYNWLHLFTDYFIWYLCKNLY